MSLSEKLETARAVLGKRKEREPQPQLVPARAEPGKPSARAGGGNNKLLVLAGNLAHEFLTRGTLLGRRIEPSRHVGSAPAPAQAQAQVPAPAELGRRYAEVSWLLMNNGAHIVGVVNPTQLARWLHIKE